MLCLALSLRTHIVTFCYHPLDGTQTKTPHLDYSLRLIEDKRVNVQKRTQRRIALLFPQTDKTVDQATQTEVPMREILVEVIEWHGCLNPFLLLFSVIVH